jgi:hypothetical protein
MARSVNSGNGKPTSVSAFVMYVNRAYEGVLRACALLACRFAHVGAQAEAAERRGMRSGLHAPSLPSSGSMMLVLAIFAAQSRYISGAEGQF